MFRKLDKDVSNELIVAEDVETGWLPSYLYISNQTTLIILGIIGIPSSQSS